MRESSSPATASDPTRRSRDRRKHARGRREGVGAEKNARPARIATGIERTRRRYVYPSPSVTLPPPNGNRAGHRIQTERARRTRARYPKSDGGIAPPAFYGDLRGPAAQSPNLRALLLPLAPERVRVTLHVRAHALALRGSHFTRISPSR